MVIVIGTDAENVCQLLRKNGISTTACLAEQISSLTSLLLSKGEITNIVLLHGEEKNWSMGHILAAAKQLQGKGNVFFVSPLNKPPAMIRVVETKDELLQLLSKPRKSTSSSSGGTRPTPEEPHSLSAAQKSFSIAPLAVPPGKILFLGVVGSQHRIGCTTQAVGLWHYCKALGFDAAIVSSREQIAAIAGPMRSQEIQSGYKIEGIPFVADTALQYDCYILDIGPGSIPDALRATDCLVLVAGSKPWELQHTAAALRAAKGKELPILLSFSSEADASGLRPLFGQQRVAVVPWMPELWHPSESALAIYDNLLRPFLENIFARNDLQFDEEIQFTKGE